MTWVSIRSSCFLDRIQWIQCPLWVTTKCIPDSPCSFTSVSLLVFVPVSQHFCSPPLSNGKKKKRKKDQRVLSHIQATQSENHLRPIVPSGTERCRQHFVLLQGEGGISRQFSSDFQKSHYFEFISFCRTEHISSSANLPLHMKSIQE